jgi:protein-disulfide isomerase
MEPTKSPSVLNIPTAIIIAGAFIAIAVIWTKAPSIPLVTNNQASAAEAFDQQLKPITSEDHILGNPKAKIKIIEYSDTSCPFCKVFHNTMKKVMVDYGASGNVAWIYRHYPLDKPDINGNILHPNASREAQALECAADLGGNDTFWKYTNRLYEITPSVTGNTPNGLDQKQLPEIAKFAGIDVEDFNNCLSTNKFKSNVEQEFTDGVNIGIQGTPTSIIILEKAFSVSVKEKIMAIYEPYKDSQTGEYPIRLSADSKMAMLGGAMPLEVVKATIDLLFTN